MRAFPFHLLAQFTTMPRFYAVSCNADFFWLLVVHFIPFANKAAMKRNLMPVQSREILLYGLFPYRSYLAPVHRIFHPTHLHIFFSFFLRFLKERKCQRSLLFTAASTPGRWHEQRFAFQISNCLIINFRLVWQREFLISNCALVHRVSNFPFNGH